MKEQAMIWQCFLLEPTDRVQRALRRYSGPQAGHGWTCETGYHNAMTRIEDGPLIVTERGTHRTEPADWPHDDPRWPTHCACGYAFDDAAGDQRQLFYAALHRLPDGQETTLHDAPAGAMWDAAWLADHWHGADGRCLMLKLPDGSEWVIDGPAGNAPGKIPGWERTGTPPLITARPSILSPGYHGFLTDGVLTDDLEGRTYAQ
jgi:hypothetical protein